MRGLTRRWRTAAPLVEDGSAPARPGLPLMERLLASRGLVDADRLERFCQPRLQHLHDPGLLPGADVAAKRIVDALRRDERIVVFGDYDVDGITAAAILFHVIRTIKPDAHVRTYVPHRLEEGYGISCEALRQLRRDGAELVISVDCGITAADSARTARDIGLDLIITDHHHLPESGELPDAVAIVHPRLPGSRYPFGDLCGAGVAFKLAWRLATAWCDSERVSESLQQTLLNMLPLAALGTIADVVPLIDENRVLTTFGLRLIKQTPLVGLRALIEASKLMDDKIDCEKVGFVLGPRLNACGRLGHAGQAVRLFTDAPPEEAAAIACELTRINEQRQRTERTILERAMQMAEDAGMTADDRRMIVLAEPSWHPGVVGIVCSRLADRFGRPAILMQRNGEYCKGSARSVEGYSIHHGLSTCAELLTTFGGHDMAAGLTLPIAHLDRFTEHMIAHANEHIAPGDLMPAINVDCDAWLDELDVAAVERLAGLSPFGRANPRPTLRVPGAIVAEPPRQVGANGKHLIVKLRQETPRGRRFVRAVWWRAGSLGGDIAAGMHVDAALEPKINDWQGRRTVEAEIRDVRVCESAAV